MGMLLEQAERRFPWLLPTFFRLYNSEIIFDASVVSAEAFAILSDFHVRFLTFFTPQLSCVIPSIP